MFTKVVVLEILLQIYITTTKAQNNMPAHKAIVRTGSLEYFWFPDTPYGTAQAYNEAQKKCNAHKGGMATVKTKEVGNILRQKLKSSSQERNSGIYFVNIGKLVYSIKFCIIVFFF